MGSVGGGGAPGGRRRRKRRGNNSCLGAGGGYFEAYSFCFCDVIALFEATELAAVQPDGRRNNLSLKRSNEVRQGGDHSAARRRREYEREVPPMLSQMCRIQCLTAKPFKYFYSG